MAVAQNLTTFEGRKLRILLADDHPVIMKKVRAVLESNPLFDVCGEATDGGKAVEGAVRLRPDVVVLNVSMPVLSGFVAARKITAKASRVGNRHLVVARRSAIR